MKVLAIVGSLRQESWNYKVAKFIQERFQDKLELEIVGIDLPIFSEDMEEKPPQIVLDFKEKVDRAEGVLFVTPEYNHSIPGGLKNAIDWCSRVHRPLANKPCFIVGASTGNVGTARCQLDLRNILNAPGVAALCLPGNHVQLPEVQNSFDENGNFIDSKSEKYMGKVIDAFLEWAGRFQ
ncbi:MAG: NADPH-dependent FMN reductase [Tissierellia bacterium]|nr:NADPH-dependent FMN reductase [Tissierellia bacterium]